MSRESQRDLPLRESGLLTNEQVARLGAHWVTTLEQLLVLGASATRRQAGAELLGMEATAFDGVIEQARVLAPEVAAEAVAYPFEDFLGCHNWNDCQRKGLVKVVDRDYIIKPGDIIEIRFNV